MTRIFHTKWLALAVPAALAMLLGLSPAAVTPAQAVQAGSDHIVVGRPIRDAPDPAAAARRVADEIAAVL